MNNSSSSSSSSSSSADDVIFDDLTLSFHARRPAPPQAARPALRARRINYRCPNYFFTKHRRLSAFSPIPFGYFLTAGLAIGFALVLAGCTVVSENRVFPKLAWYWTKDAQEQRREDALIKANAEAAAERARTAADPGHRVGDGGAQPQRSNITNSAK